MSLAEGNLQAAVVFRKQLLFTRREVLWSVKFTKRDVQAFGSSYKDTLILCLKKYTEVTVFDIVALRRNMTCSLNLFGIPLVFGVVRLYDTVYSILESLRVVCLPKKLATAQRSPSILSNTLSKLLLASVLESFLARGSSMSST